MFVDLLKRNHMYSSKVLYESSVRTVKFAVGCRITCSSSDDVSDSESEPVAKNLLMFDYRGSGKTVKQKQKTI